jgi:hydroxypyruvate isomerase
MRFSANTGFLYKELPFLERIRAAAAAGFDAVEFHDEAQREDPGALADVLAEAGLPVVGLNVAMGETSGCAAVPGAEAAARAGIDAAARVAEAVGAGAVHVLSGKAEGAAARAALVGNLRHALGRFGGTVLIEPICRAAVPGYFLNSLDQAAEVIGEVGDARVKVLFDCYHVETEHGGCLERFLGVAGIVGHVQIASVPGRNEPTEGALDYAEVLPRMREAGYAGAFGCEYRPLGAPERMLAELRRRVG